VAQVEQVLRHEPRAEPLVDRDRDRPRPDGRRVERGDHDDRQVGVDPLDRRRDVLHLAGPADWFDARQREHGWALALRDAGLTPAPVVRCDWSAEDGYQAGVELADAIAAGDGPTAVFAANDQLALGLLRALWERGVRVPQDVSVAGFDDIAGAAYFVPSLTTVSQPFAALGRTALESVAEAIEGAATGERLIEPALVVRASTGVPRG
jgi:DNA-binding LacI/PurR family transcriptional regulator